MSRKESTAGEDMLWQQIAVNAVLMAALSKISNGAGPSARTAGEALGYAKRLAEDDVYAEEPVMSLDRWNEPVTMPGGKRIVKDEGDALGARIKRSASTGDAPAGKPVEAG